MWKSMEVSGRTRNVYEARQGSWAVPSPLTQELQEEKTTPTHTLEVLDELPTS